MKKKMYRELYYGEKDTTIVIEPKEIKTFIKKPEKVEETEVEVKTIKRRKKKEEE